jgi:hypothetical protein
MSREPLDCSTVIDRLIEGERPASDPLLSEHVGSCLTCFRTANDLKSLPLLQRQLLDAAGQASELGLGVGSPADPGPAFWAAFPAQVSAAWESTRNVAAAEAAALAAARAVPGWRERCARGWAEAKAWLRLPVPAALGGAVCAAAIILAVARPWSLHGGAMPTAASVNQAAAKVGATGDEGSVGVVPSGARGAEIVAAGLPALAPTAGSLMPGGAMDDSLKELDVEGLWAVRAGLQRSLNEDVHAGAGNEAYEAGESNSTALSDELEELNDAGLALLSHDLEGT